MNAKDAERRPAIVLGTHTMGLGVIRALSRMGVPVIGVYYDRKDMGYASRYLREKLEAPHPEREEERFLDLLMCLGRRYPGSVLFPVSDETLKMVSRYKPVLEQDFIVACPDWTITRKLIEKRFTYALADQIGVPAPKTLLPDSLEAVEEYSQEASYPCLVKPVESHVYFARFHTKMVKAYTPDDLIAAYRQAAGAGLSVVLQELIPGGDTLGVNYNSYFWEGQPLAEFTAQKVRSAPPELGSPCVARSERIPEVMEAGRAILKAMNFYGYSCTEFKLDPRDGVYKLMEVNGRHNLSTQLAVSCGLNFPWLHYRHLTEGILPESAGFRTGLNWIDGTRDIAYLPRYLGKERSLSKFLKPYFQPHVFAVLDWKDPLPILKRWVDLGLKGFQALPFRRQKHGQALPQT